MKNKRTIMLSGCVCLILVLAAMPFVAACAEPAPSPAPTPAPSPAPAPAPAPSPAPAPAPAPAEAIKLVASSGLPPLNRGVEAIQTWINDFEEKTGGQCTVELVVGGALLGPTEAYDGLLSGVADIVHWNPPNVQKRFPIGELPTLFWGIFDPTRSGELMSKVWYSNVWKKGYLDEEYAGFKVLTVFCGSCGDWVTANPVNSLAELKGVKLATTEGPYGQEAIKRSGGVPVVCVPPGLYEMLEKGVADGMAGSVPMIPEFQLDEFVTYMLPIHVSHMSHVFGMNQDTYNKLPNDVKAVVDDMAADEKYALVGPKGWDEDVVAGYDYFEDKGGVYMKWSDEDIATLNKVFGEIWEEELVKFDEQGIPARKVCDEIYNGLKALGIKESEIATGYKPGG